MVAELPLVTGVSELVAAAGGTLYDATGSSGVVLESGLLGNKWQTTVINGRMILVNGVDAPRIYDGSTVTIGTYNATYPTETLVPSKLVQVCQYKSRLYFVERDSTNVWYGDTATITGNLA
ncbi:MAG: hypothetical protein ACO3S8_00715, partial [Aquiluna sp.]